MKNLLSYFKKKSPPSPLQGSSSCCLCGEELSGRILRDSWGHAAHLSHTISFCSSCERILSPQGSGGGYQYSDGRLICGFCKKTAITNKVDANRCRRQVLERLEKAGFIGIPKNIEVVLAHPHALSAHSRKRHTAGLTLSHFHFSNYKRVGITHQVGVLFGLPESEFKAVVAHELLHVWQHEHGVKFSPMYCEGLCELGGFLIYSEERSELSRHFIAKMRTNKDPVYGNGFRLMLKKLEALGWAALIAEVLKNKRGFEPSVLHKIFGRT